MLGVVVLLLICPLAWWVLWWWNETWFVSAVKARCLKFNTKIPPGHLGFPFFGETLLFFWYFNILRRPDDFITSKRSKYGDNVGLYRTYLYGSPSVIACSPSICKQVLNASHGFIQEWPTTQVLGSNSVITLEGPHHGLIKGFIANAVTHPDALARIVLQIQPSIVAALRSWSQMPGIKTFYQVKKVTLGYTVRYMARFEVGADDQLGSLEKLFDGLNQGLRAHPWNFPGTTYYHALKCRRKITKKLKGELERRKKINRHNTATEEARDYLMDGLMQMKDKEGRHLSDEEVIDNVLSSIHVGHIAIAYLVTWSMYFLANSPHVLEKLREENKGIVRETNRQYITYGDILKLKYTNKVVEETIRMANLSGFIFRKATDDIEVNGYIIPKDWKVILWLRYLHTDSTNFEDPLTFNPERWNERPKHGTYLPFGGGPRSCPGSMLARVNLALFLHHLSVGYKWELLNPDATIKYLSHPLPANGLEVSISKS